MNNAANRSADYLDDEFRTCAALEAMAGLETLLETLHPEAQLPASSVLGLIRAVHAQTRDVLIWLPRAAGNDNR